MVKGDEHVALVRGVVDQFVPWFDWCGHIFRESIKAANWLTDNGDSGPGAQWEERLISTINAKITSYSTVFRWGQKGERTGCGCLDAVVTG